MSDTKQLGGDLTASLLAEDPFLYAHLVKFERVPESADGQIAEKASDYSYITDASFDIAWNDGSKNLEGDNNGEQTYIAGSLTKVSNVSETTEAKVSNVTLQISSIALGSQFVGSATNRLTVVNSGANVAHLRILDSATNDDWVSLGFSEGDQVKILSDDSNSNKSATITHFINDNYTAVCKHPSSVTTNVTALDYTIVLDSSEVKSVLNDPTSGSYNGYINREVSVYKAHIEPDTGKIIGNPYMLFKGIISKAKLTDDPSKNSSVTWTLTSHWGDFIRVNGRMTSDDEHRAKGANGKPDLGALFRDDYIADFGFMHGEQAINIMAIYQVMETRYKLKKSGFIFKKYKQVEYQVEVDREVDLRINLEAKRLPLIYGVQRTDSIPIFADSLHSDPAKIYVAYAICEGEVSGLYDIYVDDQSRICIDKNDSDTRSSQTTDDTIDVICEGRMDRGDTLSSAPSVNASRTRGRANSPTSFDFFGGGIYGFGSNWLDNYIYNLSNISSSLSPNGATGITHERQTTLQFPIKSKLVFHAGRAHQRADDTLANIAKLGATNAANGFKLQADSENKDEYWTPNHRLLDTAYVVAEYEIAEGDTTIPSLDFVVRGKEIEQYNYDYSYDHAIGDHASARASFKVGDYVDIWSDVASPVALSANVQIVDASTYVSGRNEQVHKFRFASNPLIPAVTVAPVVPVTSFYMVPKDAGSGSSTKYPMITWDYKAHSGSVPSGGALFQSVSETQGDGNATITDNSGGDGVNFTELAAALRAILTAGSIYTTFGVIVIGQNVTDAIATFLTGEGTPDDEAAGGTLDNKVGTKESKDQVKQVAICNAIQLASTASSVNDYYVDQIITVVNTNADGVQKRQSRKIIKYIGAQKIALVGNLVEKAAAETAVTGTHTVVTGSWGGYSNPKTIVLDNVTNLAVGQFLTASDVNTARIESGTKITAIDTTTKTITVDKDVYLIKSAVISFLSTASGAAEFTLEPEPADFSFIPQDGDTYSIAPLGDTKVSINPAIQLLDYLTNGRYGRGLRIDKDIELDAFRESARLCDTRSDVSLILPSSGTYNLGAKWKSTNTVGSTAYLQWQGTIKSTSIAKAGFVEVVFKDCIGKIVHKWFNWKPYEVGNAIYHKVGAGTTADPYVNKVYLVTTAGTIAAPSTGNAASLAITSGSASVNVHGVASAGVSENESGEKDNPVVKSFVAGEVIGGVQTGSYEKSGYDLYDSDDVKYWRYIGWQEHNQREVTRHQTNSLIRTDTPLFDNVNSLLKHFNGILRYSNGKYELDVESTTPTIGNITPVVSTGTSGYSGTSVPSGGYTDPRIITDGDIIGAITVDDAGLKGSANTVSVSIADPNIRYDSRSISFFKSTYLKEDRNIPKKKDVKTPLITNYFNARINAEQYLDQSRFSRKINFVIGAKGTLLLAGTIIKVSYERFGWVNKEFRISNLTHKPDCSVQITAEEHNDDTYIITAKEKDYQAAGPTSAGGDETQVIKPPTGLTATNNQDNKITLSWINTLGFGNTTDGAGSAGWFTEVFFSNHATFTNTTADTDFSNGAIRVHTNTGQDSFEHIFPSITADTTRYYWVRHKKEVTKPNGQKIQIVSAFVPLASASGVEGKAIATPITNTATVNLFKATSSELADGTNISGNSQFPILVVTMDSGVNHGIITGVKSGQGSAAITSGQIIGIDGSATGWYTGRQSVSASVLFGYEVYRVVATAETTAEVTRAQWTAIKKTNSFGSVGAAGDSGPRVNTFIIYHSAGSASSPGNPAASLYTFANNTFTGLTSGWSTTAPTAVAGVSTSNYWYATVDAQEGVTNGVGTGNTSGTDGFLRFSAAYIGLAFTGLVTFNSLTAAGSTQINGANITTGTINANRISLSGKNITDLTNNAGYTNDDTADSAFNLAGGKNKTFYQNTAPGSGMIVGDLWVDQDATDVSNKYYRRTTVSGTDQWLLINPSTVGGWNLTASSLFSGTLVNAANAAFTSGAGHISINSGGSIHTPKFYVNQQGNAGFSGVLTFTDGTMDLGGVAKSTITNSEITLSDVSSNLADKTPGQQVQEAFTQSTNITAGKIRLQSTAQSSNASNCIELDAGSNQIVIKDGGVSRVIIGKL